MTAQQHQVDHTIFRLSSESSEAILRVSGRRLGPSSFQGRAGPETVTQADDPTQGLTGSDGSRSPGAGATQCRALKLGATRNHDSDSLASLRATAGRAASAPADGDVPGGRAGRPAASGDPSPAGAPGTASASTPLGRGDAGPSPCAPADAESEPDHSLRIGPSRRPGPRPSTAAAAAASPGHPMRNGGDSEGGRDSAADPSSLAARRADSDAGLELPVPSSPGPPHGTGPAFAQGDHPPGLRLPARSSESSRAGS